MNGKAVFGIVVSALLPLLAAAAPVTVAYPVPGRSDLMPDADIQRIVLGGFLDDFFRHATNSFVRVSDPVKRSVLSQINSGAWEFETPDKRVNFSRWRKVDLFVDFTIQPEKVSYDGTPSGPVRVDFWYPGADASRVFSMKELGPACEWIAERILAACPVQKAEAERLRRFVADRRTFLYSYYLAPGIVGHYTDSGVEPRMNMAQECFRISKNNPLALTRIVDAAYLAVVDKRKMNKLTPAKVKQLGLNALESLIGKLEPVDEEILRPFLYHYRDDVRKVLARMEKVASSDSLEALEDAALSMDDDDDEGEDLALDKKKSSSENAAIKACVRRFRDWCDNGYEVAPPVPGEAEEVARLTTASNEHPLLVRHRILKAAERKDVAALEAHLDDFFRHTRALALAKLAEIAPEKAYPHLLKAMTDAHTWARFMASIDLARLAKREDAGKIRAFLEKERNRVVKAYLADALAKAEGRPLPPSPQPPAHPIPTDRTLIWGYGGRIQDHAPWTACYDCSLPQLNPSPERRRAYDQGLYVLSRPTPAGDGGVVVSDPAMADLFWTKLEQQIPDLCLRYSDCFLYGEESMGMDPWANWKPAWTVFCEEAGIDPARIGGDRTKLTEEERLQFLDWGKGVCVEGFNVMYDFTKAYFGKLKPGITVGTATCHESGVGGAHAADWKFDISMGYIYGVGPVRKPRWRNRRAYAYVRLYRTMWPDRPCQWGSWGMPRHPEVERQMDEAAARAKAQGRQFKPFPCYKQIWEQEPMYPRFDECYSATITSYQAGGMPGWFTAFATKGKDNGPSCVWLDSGDIYPGYEPSGLERGIQFAFANTLVDYQDALRTKKSPSLLDADSALEDEVELEESGGKNDPAVVQQQEDIRKFRIGYHNAVRYVYDTARTQTGLPVYEPDFNTLILATGKGRYEESSAAQWMDGFDYADNAIQVVQRDLLKKYRFISVSDKDGSGTAMDENTKRAFLAWLKDTPGVLWVEGVLADNARRSFDKPKGDLVSKWPWDVEKIRKSPNLLTVWKDPSWKSIVIFEKYTEKPSDEAVEEGGRIVKKFFADRGVAMNWPVAPGVITTKVGNLVIQSLSSRSTYSGRLKGVELLTGERDPLVTPEGENSFAMVATGDYTAPFVTVQNGVRVLAGNRFEKVEKVPGGVRVRTAKGPLGEPTALPAKDVKRSGSAAAGFVFTR